MKPDLVFGDVPPEYSDWETARVVIYSAPFEQSVTFGRGTSNAPRAILEASTQVELYDERTGLEPYQVGIATLPNYDPDQWRISSEAMVERVRTELEPLFRLGKWPVLLGGEHTVSVGAVQAARAVHPHLSVLQIDAHADLRNEYQGSRLSHACVMSRIAECCPFVGVGIRSLSREEADRIRTENLPVLLAHQMRADPLWMQKAIACLSDMVYLTFDTDALDPSILPATGTPEPGGLLWEETLEFLHLVFQRRTVVGADIVELAPQGGSRPSDFLAARLVYKLIGFKFCAS